MNTIWDGVKSADNANALNQDIERDIVVVGGGIAGVLTAYHLAEKKQQVTLIEAKTLFSGVTHYTTAHMDAMQGYVYDNLKSSSIDKAKLYFESQIAAIDEYEKLIKKHSIDCDFERLDSYMYTINQLSRLKKEYYTLIEIGADAEFLKETELLNFPVQGAIKLKRQAQFHPIKFLNSLPKNFEIIENTRVIKVNTKENILYTSSNKIRARKIVIATGYPIIDVPGWYFVRMYKSQSYSIAIDKGYDIKGMYQSDIENGLTFRNYKKKVIIGGLDHRAGRFDADDKFKRLNEAASRSFPDAEVTNEWDADDCITFDSIPFAGYYTKDLRDIYVITGFNKWGMTNSMACSKVITDMIMNKSNKYEKLFSPQRKYLKVESFITNTAETVKDLVIKPLFPPVKTEKSLAPGTGDIIFYKGSKKAVYKDEQGFLYVSNAFCAHLKCQLKFNPNTKTWDCPCHGSRFNVNGDIIVSPTVKPLETEIVKDSK